MSVWVLLDTAQYRIATARHSAVDFHFASESSHPKPRSHCLFLLFLIGQVIEKCLHRADRPTQALIIAELTNPTSIAQMLYDQYANYVVQRALSVADEEQGELHCWVCLMG